jgi:S-formylglutathione hydrolase
VFKRTGFLGPAAKEGISILFLYTSPRGAGIEDEDKYWDFGIGAGFYLNATHPTYEEHYNTLTRVTMELQQVASSDGLGFRST